MVLIDEVYGDFSAKGQVISTLEEAFAGIACQGGLSYRFVAFEGGCALEMTDVERPDLSPEPILSNYKRPRDAQHDLRTQAIDGRLRGHVAIHNDLFGHATMMSDAQGTRAHVA